MTTRSIAFASVALCLMVLGMSLYAQNQPANVAGNWEMTLDIPQG